MSKATHHEMKEQVPAYLLGALEPAELADFQHHLEGCAECQAELRWLEASVVSLATEVDQVEPGPGIKRSVMESVRSDVAGAEAGAAQDDRPSKRRWFRLPDLSSGFAVAGALALVAVLLVGGILGYSLSNDGGSTPTPGSSPDRVIAGTSVDGSDVVLVKSGNSGTLRISNLNPPQNGDVYQAWIERDGKVEPTDSLFLPRDNGTATTSVPDLKRVKAVYVTAEPEGGSQSATTDPVITVEL